VRLSTDSVCVRLSTDSVCVRLSTDSVCVRLSTDSVCVRLSTDWRALDSEPERARQELALIGEFFRIERGSPTGSPISAWTFVHGSRARDVERFFARCHAEAANVVDDTPIAKEIGYARNLRTTLSRFLHDGRLPVHNNTSRTLSGVRSSDARTGSSSATTMPPR
jgi:hypothetical protein